MTKDEVLQGALALNGDDKKYTVSVGDDKIIIEAKYYGSPKRNATFRCVAHLNDDKTYVETHSDHDGSRSEFGKVAIAQKYISFSFGEKSNTIEAKKESFNSENIKKVLRDYLEACGYKRTNKGFFKKLFGS
jgi:hypothetical protein